jgi:isoaspartyl peptidase/L-asparaginase-like protein (Ntn-hydrolase superfamily)
VERFDRRTFLAGAAATTALASAVEPRPAAAASTPVFLSTWQHGAPANTRAAEVFAGGGSLLDAVERGINVPENDPNVQSVGYGGLPNAEGQVELDAGIMDGTRHRAGAVCSLRDIKNPISVARLVMEKTRHTTLAGEGARRFAIAMGFAPEIADGQEPRGVAEMESRSETRDVLARQRTPRYDRHGRRGRHTRRRRMLDERSGLEDSGPRRRFTARRLRLLRRR